MPDPFGKGEKQARFDALLALQEGISRETQAAHIGNAYRILVDGKGDKPGRLTARSIHNRLIHLEGPEDLIGTFQEARITAAATWNLTAEPLKGEWNHG